MELQIVFWFIWVCSLYLLTIAGGDVSYDILEAIINVVISFFVALLFVAAYTFLNPL